MANNDILSLVAAKKCMVSFKDQEGFRHSVELDAESMYEAAMLAARSFADHGCAPGCASEIQIAVTAPAVVHTVTLKRVRDWLESSAKSPRDRVVKERLKEMLSACLPADG